MIKQRVLKKSKFLWSESKARVDKFRSGDRLELTQKVLKEYLGKES